MMSAQKEISVVMKTLKKHSHEFVTPALTEIAERSKDPFKVLISCILSLRTRDETTAKVSKRLYAIADNPRDMAKLPTRKIASLIRPVNYYKTKAKRIKAICTLLTEKYNDHVPSDMETLLTFKGVGRKTANIVMVYGFHKHGMPIDTHCHRVPNRLGWVSTKTPEKTELELRKIIPKRYWPDFNDLFVQFGQNICTPRNPHCWGCPITKYCRYYRNFYLPKSRT